MVKLIDIPKGTENKNNRRIKRRLPGPNFVDLTGKKFGIRKVIGLVGFLGKYSCWLVECQECGHRSCMTSSRVQRKTVRCHHTNRTKNPLYTYWNRKRLAGELHRDWQDFDVFARDVGAHPEGMHLYAPNPRKKMGPNNFAWGDWRDIYASNNQGSLVAIGGVRKSLSGWARQVGISRQAMHQRLRRAKEGGRPIKTILEPPGED